MSKKKPLIEFKNITKTYVTGPIKYQALKGVSFSIFPGDFLSIMGPSGSGKSTVMNIMGALDVPTTGEYLLKNKNISKYDSDELAEIRNQEIGFVFQSFNLLARTTVLENVKRPMMYANVDKKLREQRAMEKLKLVNLEDKAHNLSNHLSGGQIQRVAIARALVMNPSIILADEPTGNLDSITAHEIMDTLVKLNKQGATIIVITHEQDIANFGKRVIKLQDGELVSDKNTKK
ncbi:MAG: macrolide ABC transporter ATP-binding protein [Candidatus Pacebacteria bacterium CG10_big_fil_rev_8_21_14_0_10_42_12]|nr:MAG: macrolide ABC transporter ATP-binding protein [Candidatus Pacebacteria bacterium CG10_big_fil_rev_8_21_14_0_10_42_12]